MRTALYPKLAAEGIRKNRRMYLPYILTCVGMIMMQYIIIFLQYCDAISYIPGAMTIRAVLGFGKWVIAIFSLIFLFYTNSFLMRRRKKEFGLFNILGMGKRNICRILIWESVFTAVISLFSGLILGIVFSKLAELVLINIVKADTSYTISVSPAAILITAAIFACIFLLLFISSVLKVRASSSIELLHSESTGEKPPKGNKFFGIIGIMILAAAYYIAVTVKDPLSALGVFFLAVVMVIAATYLIMISGSVMFCRILQKKKSYYYKPNHFVSVSSLVYRMKRNGAGLASICILSTMVTVMISSTTALYFGSEDALNIRYPRDINLEYRFESAEKMNSQNITLIRNDISEASKNYGVVPFNINNYRSVYTAGIFDEKSNTVKIDISESDVSALPDYSSLFQICIIPLEDYNSMMGTSETLESGESLIYTYRAEFEGDSLSFSEDLKFRVKKRVKNFFGSGNAAMNILRTMAVIVPDFDHTANIINTLAASTDQKAQFIWTYAFDTGDDKNAESALFKNLVKTYGELDENDSRHSYSNCIFENKEQNRGDFYATYGGLFFLGILLSIVFILAAVLIIYYKQISEGYEDQSRFEIMQKVGMTKKEIKRSINSQLLTVFFLPLVLTGMHLGFAFPVIRKLLMMLNLNNLILFLITTALSFAAFAMFYIIVYFITSRAYYRIASEFK